MVLSTHNGEVSADLSGCGAVTGRITTHNGGVHLVVGKDTAATLDCQTHVGGTVCDVPLADRRQSAGQLTGRLRSGGGVLGVVTHNGSIRIRNAAG